jgi:hypothetical protein
MFILRADYNLNYNSTWARYANKSAYAVAAWRMFRPRRYTRGISNMVSTTA